MTARSLAVAVTVAVAVAVDAGLLAIASSQARAGISLQATLDAGRKHLSEWRVEAAAELATSALSEAPKDPAVLALAAEVRFNLGDYAAAAELFEKIPEGDRTRSVRATYALVRAAREVTAGTRDVSNPGGHFTIRVRPGKDEVLLPYAFEALEAAYREIAGDLGHAPPGRILVEVYDAPSKLARVSGLTVREIEASGTIALCKWNRLMITSPRALLRGYAWIDTLVHEFVHLVVARASGNTVPIWLHEGIAKLEEARWREGPARRGAPRLSHGSAALLKAAIQKNRLITFDEMHPSMAKLPSQEAAALAFAEVHTAVAFIVDTVGLAGLRAILEKMKKGASVERAVAAALGMSFSRFKDAWLSYLKRIDLKTAQGVALERLRFDRGGKGSKRDARDAVDVGRIPQKAARRFARLGDILHARGRIRAAIAEYEKALARVRGPIVALAAPLGQAYLTTGQCAKAVAVLGPVATLLSNPNHFARLGEARLCLGESARAREAFVEAIRLNPFDPSVHRGLEKAHRQLGEVARAQVEADALRVLGATASDRAAGSADKDAR